MNKVIAFLVIFSISFSTFGQYETQIMVPDVNDKYSDYVRQLEAGETEIDFQDFRFSFIESEQFIIASKKTTIFDSLKKEMYAKMETRSYSDLINITKQMLSIDYTSMIAHKILRHSYNFIGDTTNSIKYKTIQIGLLNSIVKKGDGQSCATAWPVIQLSEEYFILEMLGAATLGQSLIFEDNICDKMRVKVDGKIKTYYFETSKIFLGYQKLGLE
jgi:hypothetical protein